MKKDGRIYCDWCGGDGDVRATVIVGPNGTAICNECVALCQEILQERRTESLALIDAAFDGWGADA